MKIAVLIYVARGSLKSPIRAAGFSGYRGNLYKNFSNFISWFTKRLQVPQSQNMFECVKIAKIWISVFTKPGKQKVGVNSSVVKVCVSFNEFGIPTSKWNRDSVPKRRLLILRRRGNTQKTIWQCSKCPPPVSRHLLTRRTVFSNTVFSIARSTFQMYSVMAIFKSSVVLYCNHQVHRDFIITLYKYS
jgi:hypothetical protein